MLWYGFSSNKVMYHKQIVKGGYFSCVYFTCLFIIAKFENVCIPPWNMIVRHYASAVDPGFLLVQGTAWHHEARVHGQFLDDDGSDAIDWPSCSPDLNHLWDIMYQFHLVWFVLVRDVVTFWCCGFLSALHSSSFFF